MRGEQKAQPFVHLVDGRVRSYCELADSPICKLPIEEVLEAFLDYCSRHFSDKAVSDERNNLTRIAVVQVVDPIRHSLDHFVNGLPARRCASPRTRDILGPEFGKLNSCFFLGQAFEDANMAFTKCVVYFRMKASTLAKDICGLSCSA